MWKKFSLGLGVRSWELKPLLFFHSKSTFLNNDKKSEIMEHPKSVRANYIVIARTLAIEYFISVHDGVVYSQTTMA